MIIKSISYSNEQIIQNILKLHVPGGKIDLDPTYSKGAFYKHIEKPALRFDIEPKGDVQYGDCRHLPLEDGSVDCIMFDPPFLATTGKSLKTGEGNIINKRFGVYPSEADLQQLYIESLIEFKRILRPGGILIFKCQDKISSGKQYMMHCFVWQQAVALGYYPKDLFILLAKSRLVANWQAKNQKNARKFHSYFWVLRR